MALSLDSIKQDTMLKAPRIVLLGVEKIGKSTFACGSRFDNGKLAEIGTNSPIVIPVKGEEGVDSLDVPVFPTCNKFADVIESLGVLYKDKHEFGTIVLDSASALEPVVWQDVCDENHAESIDAALGGYNKGYNAAVSKWRELTEGLDALREEKNMSSVIIGHVKTKRFDDPTGESYDQYQFDVRPDVSAMLFRWADLILFANTKVVVKKEELGFKKEKKRGIDTSGGQRFLFTQKRPAHPGGGRGAYGSLPYELPLDWTVFQDAVANAANS